jgi:hypothetical protein
MNESDHPETCDTRGASSTSRRRLLKALGLGGASAAAAAGLLPARWTRPVIDSVLLPAHAQATGFGGSGSFATSGVPLTVSDAGGSLLDLLVPRAQALIIVPANSVDICVNVSGNVADILVLVDGVNLYGASGVAVPFTNQQLDWQGGVADTIVVIISGAVEPAGSSHQLVGTVSYGSSGGSYVAPEQMGLCALATDNV